MKALLKPRLRQELAAQIEEQKIEATRLQGVNCNLAAELLRDTQPDIAWTELPDRHVRLIGRSCLTPAGGEIKYLQADHHLGTEKVQTHKELFYIPIGLPRGYILDGLGARSSQHPVALDQRKDSYLPARIEKLLSDEFKGPIPEVSGVHMSEIKKKMTELKATRQTYGAFVFRSWTPDDPAFLVKELNNAALDTPVQEVESPNQRPGRLHSDHSFFGEATIYTVQSGTVGFECFIANDTEIEPSTFTVESKFYDEFASLKGGLDIGYKHSGHLKTVLNQGDTLIFDSSQPHHFWQEGDTPRKATSHYIAPGNILAS